MQLETLVEKSITQAATVEGLLAEVLLLSKEGTGSIPAQNWKIFVAQVLVIILQRKERKQTLISLKTYVSPIFARCTSYCSDALSLGPKGGEN